MIELSYEPQNKFIPSSITLKGKQMRNNGSSILREILRDIKLGMKLECLNDCGPKYFI